MQIPCDLGLNAMGLINTGVLADLHKCPMPPAWREARSDWRDGVLLGPLVARVGGDAFAPSLSSAFEFKDARDFGYCILGPIAFAFMSWLCRRAKENRIDRFYFLARGAYFLHELYEELRSLEPRLPASHYLKVSRRAVLPAAFAVSPNPAAVVAGVGGFKGTFGAFLNARLGLSLKSPTRMPTSQLRCPVNASLSSSSCRNQGINSDTLLGNETQAPYLSGAGKPYNSGASCTSRPWLFCDNTKSTANSSRPSPDRVLFRNHAGRAGCRNCRRHHRSLLWREKGWRTASGHHSLQHLASRHSLRARQDRSMVPGKGWYSRPSLSS